MNAVQTLAEELAKRFNYDKLPLNLSKQIRDIYSKHIPSYYKEKGNNYTYYSLGFIPICNGFERIVVGDYGAFVEFTPKQACAENFIIEPGQEYRLQERYKNTIKYIWYRANSITDTKIYYQLNTVDYADYKKGMFYVSVYDLIPHI